SKQSELRAKYACEHVILPEKYILQTNTFQYFQNNIKSLPDLYVIYIHLHTFNVCLLKKNLAPSTHSHRKTVLKTIMSKP
ncbi:hypothetical protein EVX65_12010, partial [Listeria monocytogenes]|nr:hypothetical protein [Listeria monocytogenes]EAD5435460.1 hypothetical protein [Listeria monocytogenes]EAD8990600.1 hypothetical protein [Listeria monocytogenes]EAW0484870.1 hypothetical protein [Listeria monocytogenes]